MSSRAGAAAPGRNLLTMVQVSVLPGARRLPPNSLLARRAAHHLGHDPNSVQVLQAMFRFSGLRVETRKRWQARNS